MLGKGMFSVGIFAEYIKNIDYQKLFGLCCVQTASPLVCIIAKKMGQKYPIFLFLRRICGKRKHIAEGKLTFGSFSA